MARPRKTTITAATERYLIDRSDYHRDRLVELLLPWIRGIARKVKGQMITKLDPEDLEQVGVMGLVKALPRYDGSTAVQTFAMLRIKGAMLDECRCVSVIPRLVQAKIAKVISAEKRLAQELGRKPTEPEIEAACDLTRADYLEAVRFRAAGHSVAIAPTYRDDDNSEVEVPVATDPKAVAPYHASDRLAFIRKTLLGLSKRERMLILGYYFEEQTMKQVAEGLELSESRVSQMHSQMIEQLREHHRDQRPELFELARAS